MTWSHRIKSNQGFKWYERPIKWIMDVLGWTGFTSFWGTVYYIEPNQHSEEELSRLVLHEYIHTLQRDRHGWRYDFIYAFNFFKNLWTTKSVKIAYYTIPLEVEAYANTLTAEVQLLNGTYYLIGKGIHVKLY